MIRRLALAGSFVVACAVRALAQTHPDSHARPTAHDPADHPAIDSAQHAALHALLHGSWDGTMSHHGVSSSLKMSVTHDSLHNVLMTLHADQHIQSGLASDFAIRGDTVQWSQIVSGRPCKATALLSEGAHHAPGAMKGRVVCDDGEMTFNLQKKTD